MTAVALPIDLARLRDAVERLDLPGLDLRSLDVRTIDRGDLEALRRDLARRVADIGIQADIQRIIDDVDRSVDLPAIGRILGGRRPGGVPRISGGTLFVGSVALLGGLALGGMVAFFLHPSKGPRRRRAAFRRLGRVKRRLLGARVGNGHQRSLAHARIAHARQDLPPVRPGHAPADAPQRA